MTRGQRGLLFLHCQRLSLFALRRSPGALLLETFTLYFLSISRRTNVLKFPFHADCLGSSKYSALTGSKLSKEEPKRGGSLSIFGRPTTQVPCLTRFLSSVSRQRDSVVYEEHPHKPFVEAVIGESVKFRSNPQSYGLDEPHFARHAVAGTEPHDVARSW